MMRAMTRCDVIIIGGGQAALSTGYFLRRTKRSFVILDAEDGPGGARRHAWQSLRLFSPANWKSLAGWLMPATAQGFPTRDEVIGYLSQYEERFALPIRRPALVDVVERCDDGLIVRSGPKTWHAEAVVSATGSWRRPFVPAYPGREVFAGRQLHSAHYAGPTPFTDQRVLIVGGGNSGAQILAEVSQVAETLWVTEKAPNFLPDDVGGHVLFELATERWRTQQEGRPVEHLPGGFGDIVMVPPVVDARARGVLRAREPFARLHIQRRGVGGRQRGIVRRGDLVHRVQAGAGAPRAPGHRGRRRSRGRARHPMHGRTPPLAGGLRRLDRDGLGHADRRHAHGAQHRARDRRLLGAAMIREAGRRFPGIRHTPSSLRTKDNNGRI